MKKYSRRSGRKDEQFTAKVKVFKAIEKTKNEQYKARVKKAVSDTKRSYTSFPKQTLESLIQEHEGNIESSVRGFFDRFLDTAQEDINNEELLRELLRHYNNVVRSYHELERKVRGSDPA